MVLMHAINCADRGNGQSFSVVLEILRVDWRDSPIDKGFISVDSIAPQQVK